MDSENSAKTTALIDHQGSPLLEWCRAVRLHQWLKNLLLFVPLFAAHRFTDRALLLEGLLAFFFFSVCASSVYLLNDLLDLADDRLHPGKWHRPFAARRLPLKSGLVGSLLLLIAAFSGALAFLPQQFAEVLAMYYLLTLAYSLRLKRYLIIDVIVLASLYCLRIVAGAAAMQLPLSFWLIGFSMFLFFSLALVKRYAELHRAKEHGLATTINGRAYAPDDLPMIAVFGITAGYMAVLILAFYINDIHATALYQHPRVIWLACPLLLLWLSRVWLLTHRGRMNEDPILFAIHDRASWVIGVLFFLVFWTAT